jgi:hypothetical protein
MIDKYVTKRVGYLAVLEVNEQTKSKQTERRIKIQMGGWLDTYVEVWRN